MNPKTLHTAKHVAVNTEKYSRAVIRNALSWLITALALHDETTDASTTKEIERRIQLCRTALSKPQEMPKKQNKPTSRNAKWEIYIPDEGHWPIAYCGDDKAEARRVYLKWAGRTRLPAGSHISNFNPVSCGHKE